MRLLALLSLLLLAACGQSGDLYLPPPEPEPPAATEPAPAADPAPATEPARKKKD